MCVLPEKVVKKKQFSCLTVFTGGKSHSSLPIVVLHIPIRNETIERWSEREENVIRRGERLFFGVACSVPTPYWKTFIMLHITLVSRPPADESKVATSLRRLQEWRHNGNVDYKSNVIMLLPHVFWPIYISFTASYQCSNLLSINKQLFLFVL